MAEQFQPHEYELKTLFDPYRAFREANVNEDDFNEQWQYPLKVYEETLWALAHTFCDGQCELTGMEYIIPEKEVAASTLVLNLQLFDRSYEELGSFLESHPYFLPQNLRDMFDVYIGFNYNAAGGLHIQSNSINRIDQQQYDDVLSRTNGGTFDIYRKNNLTLSSRLDDARFMLSNAIQLALE